MLPVEVSMKINGRHYFWSVPYILLQFLNFVLLLAQTKVVIKMKINQNVIFLSPLYRKKTYTRDCAKRKKMIRSKLFLLYNFFIQLNKSALPFFLQNQINTIVELFTPIRKKIPFISFVTSIFYSKHKQTSLLFFLSFCRF